MKKNGFTLIELLAVIVILAIIALIATPLVLKYIETSRIESFRVSVENIKDSALKYVANEQLNGKVTYPVIVDVQDLDFKGKEEYTGKVVVLKNGVVEEFVEKDNYRSGNGGFINKKTEPYLKVKEGKTATIDDKNGFVYSFHQAENQATGYKFDVLTLEVINSYFEVVNGTIEIQANDKSHYSTGARLIVKDNDGNIYKEYQIVIFGDVDCNGRLNVADLSKITQYLLNSTSLSQISLFAADVNRDGTVDDTDKYMLRTNNTGEKTYNQFTNKLEDV